eukprot:jgi/Mesen1/4797/ME000243S03979
MQVHEAGVGDYLVVELTDEHDIRERRIIQQPAWCPALSVDQFLRREERLAQQEWAKQRLRIWVLLSNAEVDDGKRPLHERALASLETYRQDAVAPGGAAGNVYGIASHKLLALDPAALAAVLYSDVGAPIYERVGFVPPIRAPTTHHLKLRDSDSWHLAESAAFGVTWLTRETVGAHVDSLTREVRATRGQKQELVVLPTRSQVDWFLEREVVVAEQLGRRHLASCGAICNGSLIVWAADMSKEKSYMKVLLLWHAPCGSTTATGNETRSPAAAAATGAPATAADSRGPAGATDGGTAGTRGGDTGGTTDGGLAGATGGGTAGIADDDVAALMAAAVGEATRGGLFPGGVLMWGSAGTLGGWPVSAAALERAGVMCEERPRVGSLPMLAPLQESIQPGMWSYIPQAIWL